MFKYLAVIKKCSTNSLIYEHRAGKLEGKATQKQRNGLVEAYVSQRATTFNNI